MSKQQQNVIQDIRTKRKVSISRDAAAIIQSNQKYMQQQLQSVTKNVSDKYYSGSTNDVEVAVKFDEQGKINDLANPQLALKGKLAELDESTQQLVMDAMYQFMLAMNEALAEKTKDGEEKLNKVFKSA